MDASARDVRQRRQRSLPDETAKYPRARALAENSDEPIALPNGRDAPLHLDSAANAFLSCAGR
jgi:hypothetical protein